MCLLLFCPPGAKVPKDIIHNAFENNDDGAGIAWADGKQCWYHKGLWTASSLIKYMGEQDVYGKNKLGLMLHFRLATSGTKGKDNCHPFDAGGGWVMGHNGIFSGLPGWSGESDTATFVRKCVKPILEKNPRAVVECEEFRGIVKKTTDWSKLVFLNAEGECVIFGEERGEWREGVWYSNNYSFHPRAAGFTGGWSGSGEVFVYGHGYLKRTDCTWDIATQGYIPSVAYLASKAQKPQVPQTSTQLRLLPSTKGRVGSRFIRTESHQIQQCECCGRQFGTVGDGSSWFDDKDDKVICDICKTERINKAKEEDDGPVHVGREDESEPETQERKEITVEVTEE